MKDSVSSDAVIMYLNPSYISWKFLNTVIIEKFQIFTRLCWKKKRKRKKEMWCIIIFFNKKKGNVTWEWFHWGPKGSTHGKLVGLCGPNHGLYFVRSGPSALCINKVHLLLSLLLWIISSTNGSWFWSNLLLPPNIFILFYFTLRGRKMWIESITYRMVRGVSNQLNCPLVTS